MLYRQNSYSSFSGFFLSLVVSSTKVSVFCCVFCPPQASTSPSCRSKAWSVSGAASSSQQGCFPVLHTLTWTNMDTCGSACEHTLLIFTRNKLEYVQIISHTSLLLGGTCIIVTGMKSFCTDNFSSCQVYWRKLMHLSTWTGRTCVKASYVHTRHRWV